MTDKEWKELCEWVSSLKNNEIYWSRDNLGQHITIENGLIFDKDGSVWLEYYQDLVAESRTPEQIKAIITNLL